jgi:hypothetical protein
VLLLAHLVISLSRGCRYTVTLSKMTVSPLGHRGVACQHLLSLAAVPSELKVRCQLAGGKTRIQIAETVLSFLKKF